MPANYVLGYVQRDGNEHDLMPYGENLAPALRQLELEREFSNPHWIYYFVYNADDPEQGFFSPDDLDDA